MRAVVQRVCDCSVTVGGHTVGSIQTGLLIYLGVSVEDNQADAALLTQKIINLRIFQDENGKMNLSACDVAAEVLVVSQFTLFADARKGRRPSYAGAAAPDHARELYEAFLAQISDYGIIPAHGEFGATMDVTYTNQGPVTILLDSKKNF